MNQEQLLYKAASKLVDVGAVCRRIVRSTVGCLIFLVFQPATQPRGDAGSESGKAKEASGTDQRRRAESTRRVTRISRRERGLVGGCGSQRKGRVGEGEAMAAAAAAEEERRCRRRRAVEREGRRADEGVDIAIRQWIQHSTAKAKVSKGGRKEGWSNLGD